MRRRTNRLPNHKISEELSVCFFVFWVLTCPGQPLKCFFRVGVAFCVFLCPLGALHMLLFFISIVFLFRASTCYVHDCGYAAVCTRTFCLSRQAHACVAHKLQQPPVSVRPVTQALCVLIYTCLCISFILGATRRLLSEGEKKEQVIIYRQS